MQQERCTMKIGQEHDPVEDLERDLLDAIAEAAKVRFQGENSDVEMKRVQQLSRQRLDLRVQRHAAAA
tara:strand:- start:74 stop:277 length:204 start_codon:yes stop_codon:yes gene_type:complete